MIKLGGEIMTKVLKCLFQKTINENRIPIDWKTALISPIYKKKGSENDISNYRPISMTCVIRRIYERIIIKKEIESKISLLDPKQGGFRRNRSTLHQVFILNEIFQENQNIKVLFLDLKSAYDLVNRDKLWEKLGNLYKFNSSTICRLKELFDFNESKLVINGVESEPFENEIGLLQGSSLSPILFNFYIDDLIKKLNNNPKVNLHGFKLNSLFFADDGVIFAKSEKEMGMLTETLEEWAVENNMIFSPLKCCLLSKGKCVTKTKINGIEIPQRESMNYLGIQFNSSGIDFQKIQKEKKSKSKTNDSDI